MKKIIFLSLVLLFIGIDTWAYFNKGGSTTQSVGYWEITRGGVSIADAPASDFEFIAVLVGLPDTVSQDGIGCSVEDLDGLLAVKIDYQRFFTSVNSTHTILIRVTQKSTGIIAQKYLYPPLDLSFPQNWGLDGIDLYGGLNQFSQFKINQPFEKERVNPIYTDQIANCGGETKTFDCLEMRRRNLLLGCAY